uniref:RRM domain-containing protein n=1 Tax=Acrobeloides nanus TaxID=290746 RepID=A0A914CID5_9BILA
MFAQRFLFTSIKIIFTTCKVGNLPYQATEEDLGNYFMQSGNVVNVRIVYDRETRRPKGFGFCEFDSEQGASDAVNRLNGTDFLGRQIRVNHANK